MGVPINTGNDPGASTARPVGTGYRPVAGRVAGKEQLLWKLKSSSTKPERAVRPTIIGVAGATTRPHGEGRRSARTAGAASSVNSSSCPMAASRSSAGVGRTAAGVGRTAAGALNAITKAVAGDGSIETNSSIHSPAAKPGAPVAASSGRSPMPLRRPISTKPKA